MGIPYSVQGSYRYVTLLARLRENMLFTHCFGAQSTLDNLEMEYGSQPSRRTQEDADLRIGGI
jgi:hypothetical protein